MGTKPLKRGNAMTEHEKEICIAAMQTWGPKVQKLIIFEEIAEFMKTFAKCVRTKGNYEELINEIADMEVILQQLKFMYDAESDVEKIVSSKLQKLEEKLWSENNE